MKFGRILHTVVTSIILMAVFLFFSAPHIFALQELKSEGKFVPSKGTKAEPSYEGRAGGPVYEYGKGLLLGPVLVKPFIDYAMEWDNNVFLEENGRKQDVINRLSPGFAAELPLGGGQHLLKAGYAAEFEWFNRFSDQDHSDHTFNVGADLNYVPFTLSVEDNFARTVSRADTEFTNRVGREENTFRSLLEVPFAAFFLENEIYDLDVNYRLPEDSVFDHHDFTIFQRVGFDAAPSTQLLAEYGYKVLDYRKVGDRDGDANQVALGIRGNFTERLTYQAWGGVQFRIYDESTRPDFHGFIARGALRYDFSEASYFTLKGDISPQESTFDNQSFYVRNRLEAEIRRQIAERIFFNGRGQLSYNEYSRNSTRNGDTKTRRDYVWETALGLEYLMPNNIVSFFGEYRYQARESNTFQLGYDDQTVTGGVRAKF